MHRLLLRQIKKTIGEDALRDEKLLSLLELVSAFYEEKDKEIALLENALEVSSNEINEANKKLLEQSERITNTILDSLSESVIAIDGDLKVAFVNPAAKRTLGLNEENISGVNIYELLFGGGVGKGSLKSAIELNNSTIEMEELFVSRDKREFPVSCTLSPIGFDIKRYGAVISFLDIEQKKKDERLLKLQEAALNAAANMIIISDSNGIIEYVNDSFCNFSGFSREEVVGKSTSILKSDAHSKEFYSGIWQTILSGAVWEGEIINRKKDGSLYPEEMTITPIKDDEGVITHFVSIKRDIIERKKSEEALKEAMDKALESARLKSEFLSTMSHEIRTPMNGIIGMVDLLLGTELDDEQREFVQIIKDSSNALLTIINDILDFSKIEAGKMDIEVTSFDILGLVESVCELFAVSAKSKDISLMCFVDPSIKSELSGDPTRIRQVIANLLGNAIKFTEKGEVVVRALRADKFRIRFEIEDTGIGISQENIKKLFQSFTQADGSTTRKYGGTGLGLAISKKLVELMGGTIGVESEIGKGSLFWFELPLYEVCSLSYADEEDSISLEGKKVLIVDDTPNASKIVALYAKSWGMIPECATSAEKALEILESGVCFDLAILDMAMPAMNGIELAGEIKKRCQKEPGLILFTAFDQRELYDEAIEAGFDGYLVKPLKKSLLKKAIFSALGATKKEPKKQYKTEAKPDNKKTSKNGFKVLLVEDNSVNQKLAVKVLETMGYDVDVANNGEEFLNKMESEKYDAILMDCQMPVMDGFEATKIARNRGIRVPIIAMTANAIAGDKERCIASGMDDYISKPIDVALLKEKLAFWIKKELPSKNDEPPVVDMARLADIFGNADINMIVDILKLSANSTSSTLDAIEKALGLQNYEAIYRAGHDIKGECGNIGIFSLQEVGKRLEDAAKAKKDDEIASLLKIGRLEVAKVVEYIQRVEKEGV